MIELGAPIIIGVTGHRNLRKQDIPKLHELVTVELEKLIAQYSHSEFVLLDSIASGADSLCAEVALNLGMMLICPLPLPIQEYRFDFLDLDAAVFDTLIQKASGVFVVPNSEPLPKVPTRDFYYRQAGIYIADHSHMLFALWDGQPAHPYGCGTAETVEFMLLRHHEKENGCSCASKKGAVLHFYVPRIGDEKITNISVQLLENEKGSLHKTLRAMDTLNMAKDSSTQ